MKKKRFIFKIDKEINLVIEEPLEKVFTQDEFLVHLNIGCIKYLLQQDSLFYAIMADMKNNFEEGFLDNKVSLRKNKKLSKILFEKGESCFEDKQYLENVFFDSFYMVLLTKYDDEIYFELAKMDIFDEEDQHYKLILCKKLERDTLNEWKIIFKQMQDYSICLNEKIFKKKP